MEATNIQKYSAPYASVPLMDIVRSSVGGAAVDMPVEQSSPFTFFKHIVAVPTHNDAGGYSLAKLQALDALIERLVALRQGEQTKVPEAKQFGLSDEAQDEMIKELSAQLHSSLQTGLPAMQQSLGISMGTRSADTGLVINALV